MKRPLILHPLLFSAYIVLFSYAHSFEFAPGIGVMLALCAAVAGLAALLSVAFTALTGDRLKAGIAASAFVVLFVSYGHIENIVSAWPWNFHVFSMQIGYKKVTAAICTAIAGVMLRWLARARQRQTHQVTGLLNRAGLALVVMSGLHLLLVEAAASGAPRMQDIDRPSALSEHAGAAGAGQPLPDIYYIILDTYGRTDVLRQIYDYDNSTFIAWLRNKGFYVASESHSNYSQTMLSLASSLNLTYLNRDELNAAAAHVGDRRWHVQLNSTAIQLLNEAKENQRLPLAHLIQRNLVAESLKARGYRFVAYTSGYGGVQFPDADIVRRAAVLNDFEESLLSTTPIPDVADKVFDPLQRHRERVRYVFAHLNDAIDGTAPVFVLAHILSPHSPYVFKADGSPADRSDLRPGVFYDEERRDRARAIAGYRDQAGYVTQQIKNVLETLLADSSRRRIIVLQGDHGPNVEMNFGDPFSVAAATERLSILNAYYAPAEITARLYPSITPVNTFRIILGQYLDQAWPLLPDKNYLSPADQPYAFKDVTEVVTQAVPEAVVPTRTAPPVH